MVVVRICPRHPSTTPEQHRKNLEKFGPRLDIKVGPPIVKSAVGKQLQMAKGRFSTMPALVDTGASRTVLTPEAIGKVGLREVDRGNVSRAGGIDRAGIYVASIQFPKYPLETIEMIPVFMSELPEQQYHCLLGRDVLSRWTFQYDGVTGDCEIREEGVAAWIEPVDSEY